jgi:aspartate-semialdehyde dehydrogenase
MLLDRIHVKTGGWIDITKLRVGIYGATGNVGLEAIQSLQNHPFFEISHLYASERSAGKKYSDACVLDTSFFPEAVREMTVESTDMKRPPRDLDVAFFALPEAIAKEFELKHVEKLSKHMTVITTSSALRMHEKVPLIVTEVNADHVSLAEDYRKEYDSIGCSFPQCNCTAVPIVFALKPLLEDKGVGVKAVHVDSYQSVSGSGARALRTWGKERSTGEGLPQPFLGEHPVTNPEVVYDGNVRPIGAWDSKEEEKKVKEEALKILGTYKTGRIEPAAFPIDCMCNRVPTLRGHLEHIRIKPEKHCTRQEVTAIYQEFNERCRKEYGDLPSSPENTLILLDREPQTRFDVGLGKGMSIVIGGGVEIENGWIRLRALSDNLKKGAAKGSVQLMEYLHKIGFL